MAEPRSARQVAWLAAAISTVAVSVSADTAVTLTAAHTVVALPTVTAYLDVRNENGEPVQQPDDWAVSGTLDGRDLPLPAISTLDKSGEGVAYVFLIDVSQSLRAAQFLQMRQAISTWVDALRGEDRVALASFGERYRVLLDFTSNKQMTRTALAGLGPADGHTVLHLALREALVMAGRRDRDLPARRVVVILSDGKDEGSGVTIDDLRSRIQAARVPIFAIGYSRLRGDDRQRNLDALHRLATLSGGLYREAAQDSLAQDYTTINAAIRSVYVVRFACSRCRAGDETHQLKITASSRTGVVSDTVMVGVRLPSWWQRLPTWSYFAAGLLAIGLGVAATRGGARDGRSSAVHPFNSEAPTRPEPVPPTVPQRQARAFDIGVPIALSTVKGSEAGRVYRINLVVRARIGRSAACEIVLRDSEASAEHCELLLVNGHVVLKDLESANGTLLNGAHVKQTPVHAGDLICIGRTELRVGIGESS